MADEVQALTKAFSGLGGLGVDESTMVSAVGKWRKQPEKRSGFRKSFPELFKEHGGAMERCDDEYLLHLAGEFSRFKDLMVLWAMHPWERDARLAHHVLHHQEQYPAAIVVEIAGTRSAEELLGARKAYQALFHRSLEEDVAFHAMNKPYCSLLVGLVSAYRYEGPKVNDDTARAEAKALGAAIKSGGAAGKLVENGEVVRILTTRSKAHLVETFKHYKELHGKHVGEDVGSEQIVRDAVQCLATPARYFSQVMEAALREGADRHGKEALTRVAVTRSDVDMDAIRAAYHEQFGGKLEDAVAANARGHFKDALVSLIAGK